MKKGFYFVLIIGIFLISCDRSGGDLTITPSFDGIPVAGITGAPAEVQSYTLYIYRNSINPDSLITSSSFTAAVDGIYVVTEPGERRFFVLDARNSSGAVIYRGTAGPVDISGGSVNVSINLRSNIRSVAITFKTSLGLFTISPGMFLGDLLHLSIFITGSQIGEDDIDDLDFSCDQTGCEVESGEVAAYAGTDMSTVSINLVEEQGYVYLVGWGKQPGWDDQVPSTWYFSYMNAVLLNPGVSTIDLEMRNCTGTWADGLGGTYNGINRICAMSDQVVLDLGI